MFMCVKHQPVFLLQSIILMQHNKNEEVAMKLVNKKNIIFSANFTFYSPLGVTLVTSWEREHITFPRVLPYV